MSGFDQGQIFYSDSITNDGGSGDSSRSSAQKDFREFLQHFRSGAVFIYRSVLKGGEEREK